MEVKTRSIASQYFDIASECIQMANRRPRISRNVLQAYHKEIMELAKSYKSLLLQIAEKKRT